MTYYVRKPEPVEAVFCDSPLTALGFLRHDEYAEVTNSAVYLVQESKDAVKRVCIAYGMFYLLRTQRGVKALPKAYFEKHYMSLEAAADASFTAAQGEDGSWMVSCDQCGPVGMAENSEDLAVMGAEHAMKEHGMESADG